MMKTSVLFGLVLALSLASAAMADSPLLLSYQGILTDGSGQAVADGPYAITFRIYELSSGGSALWEEAHAAVQVTKGTFSEVLGGTAAIPANIFERTLYMAISVAGGAELTPRTTLTATPYTVNAYQVRGSQNIFPGTGKVGIGTTSPSRALHVTTAGSEQVGIEYDGNDASYASIYVNALQSSADAGFGYVRSSALRAYEGVNSSNNWFLEVPPGSRRMSTTTAGNVCIGNSVPEEKLKVEGGILLGNSSNTNAGTMRWSGVDFEGYDGATWKSFTSAGSGSLPSGSSGNTLRHDGANWIATNSIYNDGSKVGIGTTSPTANLHVEGNSIPEELLVNETNGAVSATIRAKTTGGDYDHCAITKYGPSAAGSVGGISLTNLSLLDAGVNAGPLMLRVASSNPLYFMTNNTVRMVLTADGNLGINTATPGAKLNVDGNQWDLTNTEGDFKIGDATYRLKFGVATGGGGAGSAGIRVAGGAEKLYLGGGSAEVLSIDGAGNTTLGGPTSNAKLKFFRSGIDSALIYAGTAANGGKITMYDEAHNPFVYLEPDVNSTGGFFQIQRNATSAGFMVDGNAGGTGNAYVAIYGASNTIFNMSTTGNGSVNLPADAISSAEMMNEPGAASYTMGLGAVTITTSITDLGSRSIVVPDTGYVMVIATCQANMSNHVTGTASGLQFGVSENTSAFPQNQDVALYLPAVEPTGLYAFPVTVQGLFRVTTAGTYTYYMIANIISGAGTYIVNDVQLTLVYIPTGYGTVNPTLAVSGAVKDSEAKELSPINSAAERAASERFNTERIQRELEALRAEVEVLKTEARNQ